MQIFPRKKSHKFNKHAKFIIMDKLTNTNKPTEILQQCLIERENIWVQTLDAIYPKGLTKKTLQIIILKTFELLFYF